MKIIVTPQDHTQIKRVCNIDLKDLIEEAGHECFIASALENKPEYLVPPADYVMAYTQTDYENYYRITRIAGIFPRQKELIMLNKFKANEVLEELNLRYLNTSSVSSIDDIVAFSDEMVLMKPKTSMAARSDYDFMYIPIQKSELISQINASDIDLSKEEYIIQEGITNNKPIIWVGGYVNPEGKIHIDGVLNQYFNICNGYFEDRIRFPERYLTKTEEVQLNELNQFHEEAIRQIKVVLNHFETKCTPFCIQAIIDDDDEVQLLDFNFGLGKSYMLHVRQNRPEYILERLKYTYGGVDTITVDTTHLTNIYVDTPNGITEEIKQYISDKPIYVGFGQPDKDYISDVPGAKNTYHRLRSRFVCVGESKQQTNQLLTDFQNFINNLNT